MRTTPGPSLTAPALRHASSASRRHGSRSAKKKPPLQPVSTPRTPKPMEPTRYQRTPRAMAATMRWMLLTTLQRFGSVARALAGAAPVWLRRSSKRARAGGHSGNGSQGETDIGSVDVERDGGDGHVHRHRARPRPAIGFPAQVALGLSHRLAGCGDYRLLHHVAGAAPDGADRCPARRAALTCACTFSQTAPARQETLP